MLPELQPSEQHWCQISKVEKIFPVLVEGIKFCLVSGKTEACKF